MKPELLDQLLRARRAKRPVALATDLGTGEQWLLSPEASRAPSGLEEAVLDEARRALRADRAGTLALGERELFVNVFNPPLRMLVVGAAHIAQSLVPLAGLAGFEVTVVDPRQGFATDARFPGATICRKWPDDGLRELAPDRRSAVVTLTHDPKLDDPALAVALGSDAFHIGCLGSRRTHAKRLERLRRAGFGEEDLSRIRGPVGLPIGARTPAEIAVSIVAGAIAELRRGA